MEAKEYIAYAILTLTTLVALLAFIGSLPHTVKQLELIEKKPDQEIGHFWKIARAIYLFSIVFLSMIWDVLFFRDFFILVYFLIKDGKGLKQEINEELYGEQYPIKK